MFAAKKADEAKKIRLPALSYLGKIGSPIGLGEVVPLPDDDNPNVGGQAALALIQGANPQYVERLVSAALDSRISLNIHADIFSRLEEISGQKLVADPPGDRRETQRRITAWWDDDNSRN